MLTFSPFITDSHTWQKPKEYWFDSPVYDDDGNITYYQANRTGQKDNHSVNLGASLTFSIPLDTSLQRRCKKAADTQIARQQQALKDSQLSWHIARLKECGTLKLKGIEFHKDSPFFDVCADVIVRAKPGQVLPHRHTTPTSSFSLKLEQPPSIPFAFPSSLEQKEPFLYDPGFSLSD